MSGGGGPTVEQIPDLEDCGQESAPPAPGPTPKQTCKPLKCPILNDDLVFGPWKTPNSLPPWPQWEDPKLVSTGKCRGACGIDCPDHCHAMSDRVIYIADSNGKCFTRCEYTAMQSCRTAAGCREHDNCYDACADAGESSLLGRCHEGCDDICEETYDGATCKAWALKPTWAPTDGRLVYTSGDRPAGKTVTACPNPKLCFTKAGVLW